MPTSHSPHRINHDNMKHISTCAGKYCGRTIIDWYKNCLCVLFAEGLCSKIWWQNGCVQLMQWKTNLCGLIMGTFPFHDFPDFRIWVLACCKDGHKEVEPNDVCVSLACIISPTDTEQSWHWFQGAMLALMIVAMALMDVLNCLSTFASGKAAASSVYYVIPNHPNDEEPQRPLRPAIQKWHLFWYMQTTRRVGSHYATHWWRHTWVGPLQCRIISHGSSSALVVGPGIGFVFDYSLNSSKTQEKHSRARRWYQQDGSASCSWFQKMPTVIVVVVKTRLRIR